MHMHLKPLLRKLGTVGRVAFTMLFTLGVFAVIVWAYIEGFTIAESEYGIVAFGFYGIFLGFHFLTQSLFAFVEHHRMRSHREPCSYTKTIGLTISAYQEDPAYLTECLNSVRALQYPPELLRIIMVVDGNTEEDVYMMDMFREIFGDQKPGFYKWDHNYHTWDQRPQAEEQQGEQRADMPADTHVNNQPVSPAGDAVLGAGEEDPQRIEVEELIRTRRCVCIMQQWGGKREVMYTAFKALGDSVDYVQVCDSDTKLDPLATVELCKVLESNPKYGAVGGEVKILNLKDSFISFMSSLRYWMAFNVERACQSFFNCVSCISGPLGLYRNDLLQQFLEAWYNQKFLGTHCTFGDDRHLTNRMLSLGYATKYTARSKCFTETPAKFLRWMNQQTRWTKSYFREWLYNSLWWHKHNLWMPYEAIVSGIFPFFVTGTVIKLFWTGSLWDILWVFCCIQIIGLIKALYACLLRKNFIMIFMSLYSMLYMTSLLPAKYFAILTINKSSWGTSGRRRIVGNYIPLLPLTIWLAILLAGFCFTIYRGTLDDWSMPAKQVEIKYLIYGSVTYALYWLLMILLYYICFQRLHHKDSEMYNLSV